MKQFYHLDCDKFIEEDWKRTWYKKRKPTTCIMCGNIIERKMLVWVRKIK